MWLLQMYVADWQGAIAEQLMNTSREGHAVIARFTIWRSQTWDHGRQKPWPNGLALDEKAQAGEEPEIVPNATVAAVSPNG